jgi:hypothetical protein
MARITIGPQNIPSALHKGYTAALTLKMPNTWIRKRYPFKNPPLQYSGSLVSIDQKIHREKFIKCVKCFNCQPQTGGWEPPAIGPRDREWWYAAAAGSGLWYYDYFIQQTINIYLVNGHPDWCRRMLYNITYVKDTEPDENYGNDHTAIVGISPTETFRIWLARGEPIWTKLTMRWASISTPHQPPEGITIVAHGQQEDWEENEITWNNQPELGPVTGTTVLTYGAEWQTINLGGGYPAYCLTAIIWHDYTWAFATENNPTVAFRPYLEP